MGSWQLWILQTAAACSLSKTPSSEAQRELQNCLESVFAFQAVLHEYVKRREKHQSRGRNAQDTDLVQSKVVSSLVCGWFRIRLAPPGAPKPTSWRQQCCTPRR